LQWRYWSARRQQAILGLEDGIVLAADDARLYMPILRSARYGLVGRPDHLLRAGEPLIPVELKPHSRSAQPSVPQAKGARRDAWQVLANGGPATLLLALGEPGGFVGALATAGADTWATRSACARGVRRARS
jgi:Integral membrane protein DUF92